MEITNNEYFNQYYNLIGSQIDKLIELFHFIELNSDFGYKTQVSAVYSSNIEGNPVDLNSFMNHKLSKKITKPVREILEIENLVSAYEFARSNELTEKNFLECHKLFAQTLVIESQLGNYRIEKVGVFGQSGLVYLAIEPEKVKSAMNEFFNDMANLLEKSLSTSEVFYFASLIHLIFVHIRPFRDGNGRAARLIEKWFLAKKLGIEFWKLPSEKYYKDHQTEYYNNINLGVNYYELNYNKCIPFLMMLPESMKEI